MLVSTSKLNMGLIYKVDNYGAVFDWSGVFERQKLEIQLHENNVKCSSSRY